MVILSLLVVGIVFGLAFVVKQLFWAALAMAVLWVAGWVLLVAWYAFWAALAIVALAYGNYWLALGEGCGPLLFGLTLHRLRRRRFANPS